MGDRCQALHTVVEAYLGRLEGDRAPRRELALNERALPPRERLLSVFADQDSELLRGCPFHNAAVETAGRLPAVQAAVARHKHEFTQRLIEAAAEAAAADPQALGRQLAVLYEGAAALATSLNDASPVRDARAAAATLIDAAVN